jgi:hypothetical protein
MQREDGTDTEVKGRKNNALTRNARTTRLLQQSSQSSSPQTLRAVRKPKKLQKYCCQKTAENDSGG